MHLLRIRTLSDVTQLSLLEKSNTPHLSNTHSIFLFPQIAPQMSFIGFFNESEANKGSHFPFDYLSCLNLEETTFCFITFAF